MDELIRKQDALEAFSLDNKMCLPRNLGRTGTYVKMVMDNIKALPPVQPEIIHCKDCDWWTKQPDSAQGRCALLGMYPTGAWYCANARKRGEVDGND